MSAHRLVPNPNVWPYRFEFDLHHYRARDLLPPNTPNPYFDLMLFEDPVEDQQFLNRFSGTHPDEQPDRRCNLYAQGTPEELRRWLEMQRTVLAELCSIANDVYFEIEAEAGAYAIEDCQERMTALAAEHRPAAAKLAAAIRDPGFGIRNHAPWTPGARQQRAAIEHNWKYGGGYSSG